MGYIGDCLTTLPCTGCLNSGITSFTNKINATKESQNPFFTEQ
jgi:hypothetical protein